MLLFSFQVLFVYTNDAEGQAALSKFRDTTLETEIPYGEPPLEVWDIRRNRVVSFVDRVPDTFSVSVLESGPETAFLQTIYLGCVWKWVRS